MVGRVSIKDLRWNWSMNSYLACRAWRSFGFRDSQSFDGMPCTLMPSSRSMVDSPLVVYDVQFEFLIEKCALTKDGGKRALVTRRRTDANERTWKPQLTAYFFPGFFSVMVFVAGAGPSAALHDSGRRRSTEATAGGPGAGRYALPGGPAGLRGAPPRGNRNAPGGWPSLRSGAGEGRLRTRLQRPRRTGILNAPRGFASRRSAVFGIRGGRGAGNDIPGRKAAGFASSSFRTCGLVLDCMRVPCLS